jgi:hypothetical protein
MTMLVAIIAAIALTSPFGTAEGTAIDDTDGLVITVSVEVTGTYEVVLVRPFSSFEELPPTALIPRDDGTWDGTVRLPSAENWSLVFDAIEPDGASDRSDSVTLIDLGIDPVVVDGAPIAPVGGGPVPTTTWWLVAGVVLAAAALGALAWWTFSDGEASTDEGEAGVGSPDRGEGSSDDEP